MSSTKGHMERALLFLKKNEDGKFINPTMAIREIECALQHYNVEQEKCELERGEEYESNYK